MAGLPLWQKRVTEDGWQFIKYGHLRQLAAEDATEEQLAEITGLRPAVEQFGVQLRLL